jgi:hypothetical protein
MNSRVYEFIINNKERLLHFATKWTTFFYIKNVILLTTPK